MSAAAIPRVICTSIAERNLDLPETKADLRGRVMIITGANTGLGLESAKRFYEMQPAHLILSVRNISKGEAAKQEIISTASVESTTKLDVWELDLASFESVKVFGRRCEAELERLDILLENGGVNGGAWSLTKDGWENWQSSHPCSLQVNVLSTFLLAGLLAPLLAKTAKLPVPGGANLKPHLVVVSSDVHQIVPIREKNKPEIFRALNDESQFRAGERYALTKLLDLLMTEELAKVPLLRDVIVCSVNPGFCQSDLMREASSIQRRIGYAILARTTALGARTYLWAALTNDIPPGSYTSSCRVLEPSGVAAAKDAPQVRKKLWNEMTSILTIEAPDTAALWATSY
ncbi:hypothetical protein M408DRAFT_79206 [Serendipita vermifera MAFF 305830]|uniref:Ketoreductase (KR) domain-containing protein n=1 Tax=Serendipita vermifera MAFF 305830 TaxID=933852 RepID=A0A0C3ACC9_SERVB|nr:hypothetical protein M408DRAFT_79206 [Serendipita vermifera MAFF 305830]